MKLNKEIEDELNKQNEVTSGFASKVFDAMLKGELPEITEEEKLYLPANPSMKQWEGVINKINELVQEINTLKQEVKGLKDNGLEM